MSHALKRYKHFMHCAWQWQKYFNPFSVIIAYPMFYSQNKPTGKREFPEDRGPSHEGSAGKAGTRNQPQVEIFPPK